MLDILDVINEATKEANSFENHAAKELTLEERVLYLQGLALVMNADGEIHAEEKEYIRILIKSFEMDESSLDSFVEFAQRPDKDTVQAFFGTFRRRPIAQLFLFDALMMTRRDDSVDEREKAVVDKIAEQLEVRKGTYQDIFDLFCHIKNKDWEESALYFYGDLLNPLHFKHLLDYYEVNHDELIVNMEALRLSRLTEIYLRELNKVNIDEDLHVWGEFYNFGNDFKHITENPVFNPPLPKSILIPWLQSQLDKRLVSIRHDILYVKEGVSIELKELGVYYDSSSKYITLDLESNENDIVKNKSILDFYFSVNKISLSLEQFIRVNGAKGVAMCSGEYLPHINGRQVSAVVDILQMGTDGHPNAISDINDNEVTVRWCIHCRGGHGSTDEICNDEDKRFTKLNTREFILNHGLYLVK
ncbi:TerB family tellurite resistance protein [Vibrio alginolyticus]|nr:TerB family tellurite resistance protein [Vibrio alginolyticus]